MSQGQHQNPYYHKPQIHAGVFHHDPELYVPASERAPRRDWLTVVSRIYWVAGAFAMVLALYIGLSDLRGANYRAALMPMAITALCWYGFGQLVAWILRPALPETDQQR